MTRDMSCHRPDECLACRRLIADDGSCGCVEGCAPGSRPSMWEGIAWGFVGVIVILVLWVL